MAGTGLLVSGSYFPLLGLKAAAGRLLDSNDDRVDGEASSVVLSYAYWQSGFAGNPGVVGRELVVNGKTLTIVGVAPRGFGEHDRRHETASVRADHVSLAWQPGRVPEPHRPQELLGLLCSRA